MQNKFKETDNPVNKYLELIANRFKVLNYGKLVFVSFIQEDMNDKTNGRIFGVYIANYRDFMSFNNYTEVIRRKGLGDRVEIMEIGKFLEKVTQGDAFMVGTFYNDYIHVADQNSFNALSKIMYQQIDARHLNFMKNKIFTVLEGEISITNPKNAFYVESLKLILKFKEFVKNRIRGSEETYINLMNQVTTDHPLFDKCRNDQTYIKDIIKEFLNDEKENPLPVVSCNIEYVKSALINLRRVDENNG